METSRYKNKDSWGEKEYKGIPLKQDSLRKLIIKGANGNVTIKHIRKIKIEIKILDRSSLI